eukprot:m.401600 g.401600  ORF g.401600 m.401600 type:complete len:147 (+) comp28400_c1_seq8:195-635(+)
MFRRGVGVAVRAPLKGQPVRWAGFFNKKKPKTFGKMPRGPPAREAKILKTVPMPAAMKHGATTTATDGVVKTDSVVQAWQNSRDRTQSLTTTEKRVAWTAVVSMLVGFFMLKGTELLANSRAADARDVASDGAQPPPPAADENAVA